MAFSAGVVRYRTAVRFDGRQSAVRRFFTVAAVAVVSVLSSAHVAAAASWATQAVPPPPLPNGSLVAVACATPTACIAVGNYVDENADHATLAES